MAKAKKTTTINERCRFKSVTINGDKASIGLEFARQDVPIGVAERVLCESMGNVEIRCDPNHDGSDQENLPGLKDMDLTLSIVGAIGAISFRKKTLSGSLKFDLDGLSASDANNLRKFSAKHGKIQFTKTGSLAKGAAETDAGDDEEGGADDDQDGGGTIPLNKAVQG